MSTLVSIAPLLNSHTDNHVSVLDYLAQCTTCPKKIDYKQLTHELKTSPVDQQRATAVLQKFIQWEVFTKEPVFTLETISFTTDNRAVSVPVLSLLLRSEELREYVKKYPGDIACYGSSVTTLTHLHTTLTTTTKHVTLPTVTP